MAVIKHIASKNADYTAAERYLVFQHDEKTQKMLRDEEGYPIVRENYLLAGVNCDPYNFAAECRKVNKRYGKNKDKREIKTHHYIISFEPEDRDRGLTMERAQELCLSYTKAHFPGHQMLVCAHEDGHNQSGNIHVHIVLNSVRMEDVQPLPYEMRPCDTKAGFKHNCSRELMRYLKNDLMKLCREQGLNQVNLNRSSRRVTDKEYHAKRRGQEKLDQENAAKKASGEQTKQTEFQTELDKIRSAICEAVLKSSTSEEFIRIMWEDYQVRVKESRGRWSYLPEGRKHAVTHRRLGDAFSKEMIETAIREQKELLPTEHPENKVRKKNVTFVHSEQKLNGREIGSGKQADRRKTQTFSDLAEIDKVIDLEKNTKARDSEAYAQWIKIHNLQEQAKTFRFLSENDLLDSHNLDTAYASLTEQFRASRESMKETERQIKEQNNLIRLLAQYYKGRDTYRSYRKSKNKKKFRQEHRTELELYDQVQKDLKEILGEQRFPSMQKLRQEKKRLLEQKKEQYEAYRSVREEWMEVGKIINNRDSFLQKQNTAGRGTRSNTDLE